MGMVAFARKAWGLFATSNAAAPYQFAQSYTPLDDLWREMFLGGTGSVTREQLLTVPAALRARDMICNVATLPLYELDGAYRRTESSLFAQFDPQVPNIVHLTQTIEDLWADALSWWEITAWDADDYPLAVRRRDPNNVSLNPPSTTTRGRDPLPGGYDPREGVVYVDGRPVPARRMIRFDSPKQAARKVVWRTIKRAIALDEAAQMYASDPRPADYFTPRQGMPDPADDSVIKKVLRDWRNWRRQHSTGYVPYALEYNTVDVPTPVDLQLVQLQERVSLDLAVAFGLDPSDVGVAVQSMTYSNVVDKRKDRINDVLAYFMRAMTDRLSMPDVTRPGRTAAFELDDYLRPDPKTRAEVDQIYVQLGVYGPAWVRDAEQLPPAAAIGATPAAAPAPAGDAQAPANVRPLRAVAGAPRLRFDAPDLHRFDVEVQGFAVDVARRLISGTAVPYGRDKIAKKNGRRFRFLPGALIWSEMSRVKLLEDHNFALAFGSMVDLKDTPGGFLMSARVARGAHGDRMLALAEDKVKDGLSVGVDFDERDTMPDPLNPGVTLIRRATLYEISLTAAPTFDDARVTHIAASRDQEGTAMHCELCGQDHAAGVACPTPAPTPAVPALVGAAAAPAPATFAAPPGWTYGPNGWAEAVPAVPAAAPPGWTFGPNGWVQEQAGSPPARPAVNPEGAGDSNRVAEVREELPYRFSRSTNAKGEPQFAIDNEHNFHTDLLTMSRAGDDGFNGGAGPKTEAGKRVIGLVSRTFDVDTADVNELNPTINRPDMYVDQREYRRPIWDAIGRGAPPNGVQPFMFPKFSSATGLVAAHTEGTEPASGTFVVTNQTVQPTAVSGKASLTREVWDMGGNPATASLVFNQMRRGYNEALETGAATFLATLGAAADIDLGVAPTDAALVAAWEAAVADLQFIRGYNIDTFVVGKILYKKFASAKATDGRPIYPVIGPTNVNGTSAVRFQTLDLAGVLGIPSWALPATAGAVNSSWLFDPSTVYGWATPPQRFDFPGTDSTGGYAPVAMVDIAIWGYEAFANTDIGGVREVKYDDVA